MAAVKLFLTVHSHFGGVEAECQIFKLEINGLNFKS